MILPCSLCARKAGKERACVVHVLCVSVSVCLSLCAFVLVRVSQKYTGYSNLESDRERLEA